MRLALILKNYVTLRLENPSLTERRYGFNRMFCRVSFRFCHRPFIIISFALSTADVSNEAR